MTRPKKVINDCDEVMHWNFRLCLQQEVSSLPIPLTRAWDTCRHPKHLVSTSLCSTGTQWPRCAPTAGPVWVVISLHIPPGPLTTIDTWPHQITTSVAIETGTVAWISAGILCAIGLCLCAPIPLCLGSMKVRESNMSTLWPSIIFQDAIHRCPNCNAVVGRYKAKF